MTSTRKTPNGQKRQNNSVRFVRTREGERRYGKPIGSVIVSDTDMENIKHLGNHKGWGVFRGKNGKKYQVGKVDGLWVATPFGDFTRRRSLVEGGDLQATLKALNRRAGNKAERREDTQYDRQKRAGKRGTVTGRSTAKEKTPAKRKRGTTTSSKRSASRSSRGTGSKAPAKKITKKKGDYTGANLRGLRRLVSAAFGTASSGAERSAASKVMAELEKQGLVKRTKVNGKVQWRPVDGYSASDVVAGATESEKIDSIMFELQKSEEKAMQVAERIEHRANVMFAELKGLTLHDGSVESLEQKDMQEGMEEKVRRVRTPAGVRRFKKPIGSIIGRGGRVFQNITIEDPVFDGWDLVKDKKGKKYDVGKEGGKWQAYGHNDWDDLVAEADSEDDLYEALDRKAGGAKKPSAERRKETDISNRPKLTARQEEAVNKLSEDGKKRYWDSRTPPQKASHEQAYRNARAVERGAPARERRDSRPQLTRTEAAEVGRLESNAEKGRYLELRKAGETHKRAIARVEGERSGDHTGGLSNERSRRPVNVRTADDEEREAQSDDRAPEDIGRHERVANRRPKSRAEAREMRNERERQAQRQASAGNTARPTLTAKQKEDVDALSEAGQRRYWDSRTSTVSKANHTTAMRNAKATDRTVGKRLADIRKKPRSEWTDKEILDIVGSDARDVPLKLNNAQQKKYFQAYRDGNDHAESMKIAKSRGATSRAQQIANERHGANKPKAERTDEEIIEGLNNAFRKQFDTLSSSQKRKYTQAFREGKTHSEAMAVARGGSGKAQGVLF